MGRRLGYHAALLAFVVLAHGNVIAAQNIGGGETAAPGFVAAADAEETAVRAAKENQLKELQRKENDVRDLRTKEGLLNEIIGLCIDLEREYAAYQERLADVRRQLADAADRETTSAGKREEVRRHTAHAVAILMSARPSREGLARARAEIDAGLALAPDDVNLRRLRARVEETRRVWWMRTIAISTFGFAVLASVLGVFVQKRRGRTQVRTLEMLEGSQVGEVFRLERETTSVGALSSEVDVVILDLFKQVSRRHFDISRRGRHYFLIDRSTNGTVVNGRPAPAGEPVLLKRGAVIALPGEIVLRFS